MECETGTAPGLSTRHIAILVGVVVLGISSVVAAKHIGGEALAVVVGIICGVAAAIPTSLLLLVVLTRSERRRLDEEGRIRRHPRQSYPPVVVIRGMGSNPPAGYSPAPMPGRQWQVVGEEGMGAPALPITVSRHGERREFGRRADALEYLARPQLPDGRND